MEMIELVNETNFPILQQIANNPGIIIYKISRKLNKDKSRVSLITTYYETKGLIRKEQKGRRKKIFFTPKGLDLYKNLEIIRERWKY